MRLLLLGSCLLCVTAGTGQGHQIWVLPEDKGKSARVVWSDYPKPDDVDEPLSKIAEAQVLLRQAEGRTDVLEWKRDKDAYRVACPGSGTRTIAVVWNDDKYFKKGDTLLTYVGKAYLADSTGKIALPQKHAAWDQFGFEIIPRSDRGAGVYQLVYKGSPVADTKVGVETPIQDGPLVKPLHSDKNGLFTFSPAKPGLYGLVARHMAAEAVCWKGKRYTRRLYWTTLVVQVPPVQK